MSDPRQWTNAYPHTKEVWHDCTLGFVCACGQNELQVDDQGDEEVCDRCGRRYRLIARFEMSEPGSTS